MFRSTATLKDLSTNRLHLADNECNAYAIETLTASDVLIIGRRTYELMAMSWRNDTENDPVVKGSGWAEVRLAASLLELGLITSCASS